MTVQTPHGQTSPVTFAVRERTAEFADVEIREARERAAAFVHVPGCGAGHGGSCVAPALTGCECGCHGDPDCAGDVPVVDLRPMMTVVGEQMGVDLAAKVDGSGFVLAWTDYVVNEWSEEYADLSVALLRLAVLQRCAERGFDVGFVHDAADFPPAAGFTFENLTI